jgi:regulatory protein
MSFRSKRDPSKPPRDTAKARAVNLLSRREHGRAELFQKLTTRGFEADDVNTALDRLEELRLLDDGRASEALARWWAGRGDGPIKVRAKLRQKGFGSEHIAAAMDALEVDWLDQARGLVAKRRLDPSDRKQREKLYRWLAGKGYPSSVIGQALK